MFTMFPDSTLDSEGAFECWFPLHHVEKDRQLVFGLQEEKRGGRRREGGGGGGGVGGTCRVASRFH